MYENERSDQRAFLIFFVTSVPAKALSFFRSAGKPASTAGN